MMHQVLLRVERRERPDLEHVLVDLFWKVLGDNLVFHVECVILQTTPTVVTLSEAVALSTVNIANIRLE